MKLKKALFVLFAVLLVSLVSYFFLQNLRIERVECFSPSGECEMAIKEVLKKGEGLSFLAAKGAISEELLGNPSVSSFSTRYLPPDTLRVSLTMKKPSFAFRYKDAGYFLLTDSKGTVIAITKEEKRPYVVFGEGNFSLGDYVSREMLFSAKTLSYLSFMYQLDSGELRENLFSVSLGDGLGVIYPTRGNERALVGATKYIFSRLNEDEIVSKIANVREIDLRFQNPILR